MNKRHTPEQIVRKLRQADAELAAGIFGPRGRKDTRHKRGDLPPLAQPLWRDESRCDEAPQAAGGRECPPQEDRRRAGGGHRHPQGGEPKKLLSPARRRAAVEHVRRRLGVPSVGRAG